MPIGFFFNEWPHAMWHTTINLRFNPASLQELCLKRLLKTSSDIKAMEVLNQHGFFGCKLVHVVNNAITTAKKGACLK